MNRFVLIFSFLIVVVCTLAIGRLQGQLTNRWGMRPDTKLAAERLRSELPKEVGNWRLRHEDQFSPAIVRTLQCPAHISRVYEHVQTGDSVTLAVILGPPGPTSVHTAEICYSSRDFTITGERRKLIVTDANGDMHTFWELPFKANDLRGAPLRVLYAWSTGTIWEAAQYPRFGYGGLPHLYKLQLAVSANPASQATDHDPVQDFLVDFLAQLQPRLVKATTTPRSAR